MLYGVFENDKCIAIVESGEPEDALPKKSELSTWPGRYARVDGKVVDKYVGLSDVDAIETSVQTNQQLESESAAAIALQKKLKLGNRLTRLEFLNRFTVDERISLRTIETNDPFVGVLFDMIRVAEFIDLNDATTINGIGYLATKGYIAENRVAEILK